MSTSIIKLWKNKNPFFKGKIDFLVIIITASLFPHLGVQIISPYRSCVQKYEIQGWYMCVAEKRSGLCKNLQFHICPVIGLRRFKTDKQVHTRTIVVSAIRMVTLISPLKWFMLPEAEWRNLCVNSHQVICAKTAQSFTKCLEEQLLELMGPQVLQFVWNFSYIFQKVNSKNGSPWQALLCS